VQRGSVLCLHNVSDRLQRVMLDSLWQSAHDLVSGRMVDTDLMLPPYEVLWLQHE
jgi:hypothetical protein